jgi:hypothetical protein
MISEDILDRNCEILRRELIKEMHNSLNVGNIYIEKELSGASAIIRPVVILFYNTLVKNDLEKGTLITINGIIKMGRQMILDEITEGSEEFYRRMEQKFPIYLKNDQTTKQCRTNHKNYPICVQNLKRTFEWQLRPTMRMMLVEDLDVFDYATLVRAAFKNRETSREVLRKQIDSMDYGLKIVESDLSIINIPTARDLIMRVLRQGFDHKVRDFFNQIDEVYDNHH